MEKKLEYLYKAIEDTQQTIRFTDTKAAAVQVVVIFLAAYLTPIGVNMLSHIDEPLTILIFTAYLLGIVFYFCIISSIFIAFKAINPMSSPHLHIRNDKPLLEPSIPFYLWKVLPKPGFIDLLIERSSSILEHDTKDYYMEISNPDLHDDEILKSLVLELHKVSYIREKKIFRVSRSIFLLTWSIVILLPLHIIYFYLGWN